MSRTPPPKTLPIVKPLPMKNARMEGVVEPWVILLFPPRRLGLVRHNLIYCVTQTTHNLFEILLPGGLTVFEPIQSHGNSTLAVTTA